MNILESIDISRANDTADATGRHWASRLSSAFAPSPLGGEQVRDYQMRRELILSTAWSENAPFLPAFAAILRVRVAAELDQAQPGTAVRLYGGSGAVIESAIEAGLSEDAVRFLGSLWNDYTSTTSHVVREQQDDSSGVIRTVWPPEISVTKR